MAHMIDLSTHSDERGRLTVVERVLPFDIRRVFYIYGVDDSVRGQHRHRTTVQAAVAIQGSCTIHSVDGPDRPTQVFALDAPSKCLILDPQDYHWMQDFTPDCILMVFASECFDPGDYIREAY